MVSTGFSQDIEREETFPLVPGNAQNSILDTPIGSFKGPNSLQNFASSFTRAQSFAASKIDNDIRKKRSFFYTQSSPNNESVFEDETFDPDLMVPSSRGARLSTVIHEGALVGSPLFRGDANGANSFFYQDEVIGSNFDSRRSSGAVDFDYAKKRTNPALSFSSVKSSMSIGSRGPVFTLKQVEDKEGNVLTVLAGQSTAPQTVFNSINVLIGVGLLALPVGILKAGWFVGIPLLVLCGLTTYWSATLLSDAMDTDSTIMTYADLGYATYGSIAKLLISLIFSIDLIGAGVALVVLFSDSVHALLDNDHYTKTQIKLLSFVLFTPFTFLPLPILSVFSLFGILSTISITGLVLVCGLLKADSPGSLLQVMPTNYLPPSTQDFFLAIGICMAPFGGHAIFPNLKSDMRHAHKFKSTLVTTYSITLITDISMGVLGFLMFGTLCNNEITNNILTTAGYPTWCYPLISALICLIPLAKTPLNAKPIISSLDSLFVLDTISPNVFVNSLKSGGRILVRIAVNALFVILAILFPDFDRIMGMLGASICFLVCIILPCMFYLKLCNNVSPVKKTSIRLLIALSVFLSITGTWAVLKA